MIIYFKKDEGSLKSRIYTFNFDKELEEEFIVAKFKGLTFYELTE